MVSQSGWPPPASDREVMRTFGPHRAATDVVWFWQLNESLARSVNISSAQPAVPALPLNIGLPLQGCMHFSMLELLRECGPRPGVHGFLDVDMLLPLHSGEGTRQRPRQKSDSPAARLPGPENSTQAPLLRLPQEALGCQGSSWAE